MEDEEMEIEDSINFYEVDLGYEFDAVRFYDFTLPESLEEALNAEQWFKTASSYPPSPFVTQLISREETANDSCVENSVRSDDADDGDVNNTGWRFKSQASTDKPKAKPKSSIKHIPRSSTLMKPTASQLAKQNRPTQVATSRFPTFLGQIDKGSCNPAIESQASKRQKLEGGNLQKINDGKQHVELLRKVPIKEFHLKTSERATQHSSAASSFSDFCNNSYKGLDRPSVFPVQDNENTERRRRNTVWAPQQDGCGQIHSVKALPLNKKIFSSKGDMGVFRNIKRETTLPMEFNFHTEKKVQHHLPIDLFSKLSLASERQPNNHSSMSTKVPKENRLNSLHSGNEVTHSVKGKPSLSVSSFNVGVMGASLKFANR
ncbi:hypothetical protein ACFE04_014307 [Oxalis oulophora]